MGGLRRLEYAVRQVVKKGEHSGDVVAGEQRQSGEPQPRRGKHLRIAIPCTEAALGRYFRIVQGWRRCHRRVGAWRSARSAAAATGEGYVPMDDGSNAGPLRGRRVALPETREAERLALMLQEQGAETVSCPLVAIVDAPDPAPLIAWLNRFVEAPFDDLVLLTGEGVRRLHAVARGSGMGQAFVDALATTRKITRGPKPARALRELGLAPDLRAEVPTTEGVIALLSHGDLRGRRVGVQLYPGAVDNRLVDFLRDAGATPDPVVPYEYVSGADDAKVAALIDQMAAGRIDVIAFTSAPQVRRLFDAAHSLDRREKLAAGFQKTIVAAIGPVVAGELQRRGVSAMIMPSDTYFMKPLVSTIVATLSR
jgi:uroporphyrinogen-III synthase